MYAGEVAFEFTAIGVDLFNGRRAILFAMIGWFRRAKLHSIREKHITAREAYLAQQFEEEIAGIAYERLALPFLLRAGGLTEDEQPCGRVPAV